MHSYHNDDLGIEPTFNLRLIEAVKHNRCLYDSTDRQYRSADYKSKVWGRLVSVLQFDGDPRTLYSRWKQLRDKYGKEKRKSRYGTEDSQWQYYKHLSFLDSHMIDRANQPSPVRKDAPEVQEALTDPNFGHTLIAEVREHPCLFDIRDVKYRHSDCRNQAWQEIIKSINFPGDVNSVYRQWKKFRDRYVREKRRIREQRDRGVHEESSWDLYEYLLWMDPYLDDRMQSVKRKHDPDNMSDYDDDMRNDIGYNQEKRGAGSDVLLDGDSAFAASAVSDLRTLPAETREQAKQMIIALLETGRMPTFSSF